MTREAMPHASMDGGSVARRQLTFEPQRAPQPIPLEPARGPQTRPLEPKRALHAAPSETLRRSPKLACPDCPVPQEGGFEKLLPREDAACAFRCVSLAAREPMPQRWFDEYAVGLVRRGVYVRQRVDAQGRAVAVDAVGPGGVLPLASATGAHASGNAAGYAASDGLICLCPRGTLSTELWGSPRTGLDLLRLQEQALERVERIAEARGCPDVGSRVHALLCTLADTLSPGRPRDVVPADLQQRDLAALLGVRHESVCRALRDLTRRGVVARDRDGIRLLDREARKPARAR